VLPGQYYDSKTGLHYNYFRTYDPSTGRYIESDPIGLRGGINTYVYSDGSPIINIDPYGLWSIGLEAYLGVGGGIDLSYSEGTLEFTGKIGVGIGGGLAFNPLGTPSEHSQNCGSGYIARTRAEVGAGLGLGVVDLGAAVTGSSGNAVTTPVGGGFVETSYPSISTDGSAGFGLKASANVSAEIGSYTNW